MTGLAALLAVLMLSTAAQFIDWSPPGEAPPVSTYRAVCGAVLEADLEGDDIVFVMEDAWAKLDRAQQRKDMRRVLASTGPLIYRDAVFRQRDGRRVATRDPFRTVTWHIAPVLTSAVTPR